MSKFVLQTSDKDFDDNELFKLKFEFETDSLDDMLIYLDMFLKGSGFLYQGELGIVRSE